MFIPDLKFKLLVLSWLRIWSFDFWHLYPGFDRLDRGMITSRTFALFASLAMFTATLNSGNWKGSSSDRDLEVSSSLSETCSHGQPSLAMSRRSRFSVMLYSLIHSRPVSGD